MFLLIELNPIEMKDDNVTMPETLLLYDGDLIPDLDRSLDNCGSMSIFYIFLLNPLFNYQWADFQLFTADVKPDEYGYYNVDDLYMTKEQWIEYCKKEKANTRSILDEGNYYYASSICSNSLDSRS